MESDDRPSLVHRLHIWAREDLDSIATIWPERNGIGGFALSHWRHQGDNVGLGNDSFMPTGDLATRLQQWQGWEFDRKRKVPMFSPTLFLEELSTEHNRGKENALLCRGIILDIEHSSIQPHEWPLLFRELQMILYSSYHHTTQEPRYRVCIPSTHYVSPFLHELLGKMIEHRLSRLTMATSNHRGRMVSTPVSSSGRHCSIVHRIVRACSCRCTSMKVGCP